ncbi:ribonuclease activity regulator protein RraA [Vibrio splendidus]|uniref:ribonuclease activity regulator protein RraA n=1 Tax=Vibrio splendidus TaxID=29497 RepID=UPI000D390BCB|nr:ribonuclease activity regulator protein RraA [Vibrio splendidus]PTP96321.1 ribonuclease activity regulator protein RraA [Vibrio splendidus]
MLLYVVRINPLFSLFYAQFNIELELIAHIYQLDSKDSFQLPWFKIWSLASEM